MNKKVYVSYNADTLETQITVEDQPFDTSRISGKEIADWAYPFMIRKVRWDGFYDEMVTALGGEKAFDLVFEGSDESLAELKEAWEDAPVNVVSGEQGNTVTIVYDADTLITEITVNGQTFDTTRINGKEIEDWVYPFMMRKVKWDGIFDELKNVLGADEYDIQFSGTRAAMKVLMEDCPETVTITLKKDDNFNSRNAVYLSQEVFSEFYADRDDGKTTENIPSKIKETVENLKKGSKTIFPVSIKAITDVSGVLGSDKPCIANSIDELINYISEMYESWDSPRANVYRRDHGISFYSGFAVEIVTPAENIFPDNDVSETQSIPNNDCELEEQAQCFDNEEKYEESFKIRLKAADMGNVISISNLGWHYQYGYGVEQDYEKAFPYYKKAADMGNAWAQRKTGMCYEEGLGVEHDMTEAANWYLKAAEQGHAESQWALGICYLNGLGVDEDDLEAVNWFSKSAEQDFAKAESALGDCYLNGYGVEEDVAEAIKWFEKAALQDDAYSQYMLGIAYISDDTPVEPNSQVALEWFKKSIANGNDTNPQVYMQMIVCLKDIGFSKMERNGVGYKEAAETYPEFQRIVEICDFAINNFECNNSENGIFYLELAIQYGFSEDWDKAVKYAQMATNFGVEGAADCLAGYKKAKITNVGMGVAEKVADAFGYGEMWKLGKAIGGNDNSESIVNKGADFLKFLFKNDDE